jgi:hypothetical protein
MSEVLLYVRDPQEDPAYRGTSLKRTPTCRNLHQGYAHGPMVALEGRVLFLVSEVPLCRGTSLLRNNHPP